MREPKTKGVLFIGGMINREKGNPKSGKFVMMEFKDGSSPVGVNLEETKQMFLDKGKDLGHLYQYCSRTKTAHLVRLNENVADRLEFGKLPQELRIGAPFHVAIPRDQVCIIEAHMRDRGYHVEE